MSVVYLTVTDGFNNSEWSLFTLLTNDLSIYVYDSLAAGGFGTSASRSAVVIGTP